MRRLQEVALAAFEKHGFAAVTIEAIARDAEVGPATVYRYFGTKERLVLWDEYDPMLFDRIVEALPGRSLPDAFVVALDAALGEIYARDRARILRRARLMRKTETLLQAAALDQRALREGLATLLRKTRRARTALEAAVLAGALGAALEAGVNDWLDRGGKQPLARSMRRAFAALDVLPTAG